MSNPIPLDKIRVTTDRQRQTFSDESLVDLMNSIEEFGLLHPPVVAKEPGGTFRLIAGERRLRAIKMLSDLGLSYSHSGQKVPLNHIPVTFLSDLDPLSLKEIELHENVKREDLTWQERLMAEAELVELKRLQAERRGEDPPSFREIATDIGYDANAAGMISRHTKIAAMLSDPEVAKAKTISEAEKIVEHKMRAAHHRELAATVGKKTADETIKVFNESFQTALDKIDEKFDVIIADPPYGVSAHAMSEQGNRFGRDFDDGEGVFWNLIGDLLFFADHACKSQAHMYIFCSPDMVSRLSSFIADHLDEHSDDEWKLWPRPLIWAKGNGVLPVPNGGPRYTYECILYLRRGGRPTTKVDSDVIFCRMEEKSLHPDAKPVDLYINLLSRSAVPGDRICDPCAGSGPALVAARTLNLYATLCEKSELYYGAILKRMETL